MSRRAKPRPRISAPSACPSVTAALRSRRFREERDGGANHGHDWRIPRRGTAPESLGSAQRPGHPEAVHSGLREDREALADRDDGVRAKVGPVSARFGGKVTLSDLDPPNGYRVSGEGTGGPAGFAKGGATVKLADDGGATKLSYVVEANVGGKLAQIGSRLIDATARQMAENFFAKFAEI